MPDISLNGLLAVVVFPPIALSLLRDDASRRPAPGDDRAGATVAT